MATQLSAQTYSTVVVPDYGGPGNASAVVECDLFERSEVAARKQSNVSYRSIDADHIKFTIGRARVVCETADVADVRGVDNCAFDLGSDPECVELGGWGKLG